MRIVAIFGAIIYFLSPIDLFPEILFGPFGYIDDVAMMALAFGVTGKAPDKFKNAKRQLKGGTDD